MRIAFLIRHLGVGGAQRQLGLLARGLAGRGHDVTVFTFYPGGDFAAQLAEAGVEVQALGKKGRWDVLSFIVHLVRELRGFGPDVVYAFMDVANILAASVGPFLGGVRVVWGLRASFMDLRDYDWLHRVAAFLEALLSRRPDLVIANSWAGREAALRRGFPEGRIVVIPNGIDVDAFRPDPAAGRRVREEWGVAGKELLVGMVGRLDPMKDHGTFLKSAARVAALREDVRFVCVGGGDKAHAEALRREAKDLRLEGRLLWVGPRQDIMAVMNALDIFVLASKGEGLPNALLEAMACGTPCVVTAVGDGPRVVGGGGLVVPPGDPGALAGAIGRLADELRCGALRCEAVRLERTRARITAEYTWEHLVSRTEKALRTLGARREDGG